MLFPAEGTENPAKFGASDVMDLSHPTVERLYLYQMWALLYQRNVLPTKPEKVVAT